MEAKLDKFIKNNEKSMEELTNVCNSNNQSLVKLTNSLKNLDGKVKGIEAKLGLTDQRITSSVNNFNAQIGALNTKVVKVETSAQFISTKYDDLKLKCDHNAIQITTLKESVDNLSNDLENEKAGRNDDQQYFRSAFFLKLHGIPWQQGEESHRIVDNKKIPTGGPCNQRSLRLIGDIFERAGFEGFDCNQIDVCHRTSSYYFSPIVVLFSKKADRENVFRQKKKLASIIEVQYDELNMTIDHAKLSEWREQQSAKIRAKDWTNEYPRFTIREHLTNQNNEILKAALPIARGKQYKHPGYLSKGRIHVRKSDSSDPIQIASLKDLDKII